MNKIENFDYVVCQVCGFKGLSLNRHISKHGLTAKLYSELYPQNRMTAKIVNDRQAEKVRGQRKPIRELVCKYCGGKFNHRENLWSHLKKEEVVYEIGVDGVDYLTCRICGMRVETLSAHIVGHGETVASYLEKFPNSKMVIKRVSLSQSTAGSKTKKRIEDRHGAMVCDKCGETYLQRFIVSHREKCIDGHPDKYVIGEDYVKCPVCEKAFIRLGNHLRRIHGWDADKIVVEEGRGLQLMASNIVKNRKFVDFDSAQKRREQTHLERYGFKNPFSNPNVKDKIVKTSQRRYGVDHPMKNEEILIRQNESAQNGPSGQEVFFDEHTCNNVVYVGYGGRFIRTKTGVEKYGRIVKDLNPDFMVLPDNVLESALLASKERRPLDRQKHRSKFVIELLGDYYHSKEIIGVEPEIHEKEIVAAYRSAGIECLVLWEKDVMTRWEIIRPMVDAWIDKAVKIINEKPIWSRATKNKVDGRVATLECPFGSKKKFKTQDGLDRWMISPLNFWRPDMIEGKDYVKCLECENVRVGKIAEHLRQSHDGMSKEDYLKKHPMALMVSDRIISNIVKNNRLRIVTREAHVE